MKNFTFIKKFFEIDKGDDILPVLREYIDFDYGEINFLNPKKLEYSYGLNISENPLTEDLRFKNTVFGEISIFRKILTFVTFENF